jgi:NADH:ubiquinone oxidoreductase subunit C
MPDDDAREDAHKNGDTRVGEEEKETPPPPDDEVAAAVVERFPGTVFHRSHGQPVVYVDRAVWAEIGGFLRDEQQFTQCVDVTAVDHLVDAARLFVPGVNPERFEVVASFLSHPRNRRIRAICEVPAGDATVPSLTDAYPGANFGEREVYDLFGIAFTGHPDLARILMPDDWVGYPLRKDDAPARVPVTFKEDPRPR